MTDSNVVALPVEPLKKVNFIARVWDKKYTQDVLKKLRESGYIVTKLEGGYEATMSDGNKELVFKAMNGHRGYLVRFHPNLFGG